MSKLFRIAVLISGRGSNLQAIIEGANGTYEVAAVISNNSEAAGLNYARAHHIPIAIVDRAEHATLSDAKLALLERIQDFAPDLVVLAGFMWVLPAAVVSALRGKLINIHPSLLPKFPGLDTHKRVLEAHEEEHGCTVHYVNEEVDGGPRIAQCAIQILEDDTEDILAGRVLETEHRLYPWVVEAIALGDITYTNGKVSMTAAGRERAAAVGFGVPGEVLKG